MRTFTVRVRPHSLTWRSELPVGLKKTKQHKTKQNETVKKKMEKERKATTTTGFPSRYCNIFEL